MPEYVHKYIIPITITLIALIAFVVVFFILPKRREKSVKFCRALKSECKKVSWLSWSQTVKSSLVVAALAVSIALIVGLLDLGFTKSLDVLVKFFK